MCIRDRPRPDKAGSGLAWYKSLAYTRFQQYLYWTILLKLPNIPSKELVTVTDRRIKQTANQLMLIIVRTCAYYPMSQSQNMCLLSNVTFTCVCILKWFYSNELMLCQWSPIYSYLILNVLAVSEYVTLVMDKHSVYFCSQSCKQSHWWWRSCGYLRGHENNG